MKKRRRVSMIVAVGVAIWLNPVAGLLPTAAPSPRQISETLTIDGQKAFIIVFKEEPLARYEGGIRGLEATSVKAAPRNMRDGKLDVQSPASLSYLSYLEARHERFVRILHQRAPEARIYYHYRVVLNGLAVTLPEDRVAQVAALPEVAYLAPVRKLQLFAEPAARPMDVSNPLMGVQALWDALGGPENAGRGLKIGIIDTGVDFSHPMFNDPTLTPPPGFPLKDPENLANNKVIVAKVIQSMSDSSNSNLSPGHLTAQDLVGHGTHVAGAAAGNFVDLSSTPGVRPVVLSGVAPKAFIGSYRIFAPNAGTDNLIKAIEEAVTDGMDVINLSAGLVTLPSQQQGPDPHVEAVNNAVAAGVVVCVSAGNFGPGRGTISSPGTASSAITVGMITNSHDGFTANELRQVQVKSPSPPANFARIVGARSGGRFPEMLEAQIIDADLVDNGVLDGSGFGCSSLPSAIVKGTLLLVQKGRCDVLIKAGLARLSGASALIVYNDEEGEEINAPSSLVDFLLPTVLIPRSCGLALKNLIDANAANGNQTIVTLAAASDPLTFVRQPNVLANSSSRGPTKDFLIKPDLVAIGIGSYGPVQDDDPRGENRFPRPDPGSIFPAFYDPTGYAFKAGTSFSSPRVAGAAALVKQLHPDWTPADIKAALMTTAARPTGPLEVGNNRIMERGSGAIDLSAIPRVLAIVSPPSHSFGRVVGAGLAPLTKEFTLSNRSKAAVTYKIRAALTIASQFLSVHVSPSELTIPPGGSGTFTLILTNSAKSMTSTIDNEGFIEVSDGEQTTPKPLYIPFWVQIAPQ